MQVQLTASRVEQIGDEFVPQRAGDTIDVSDAEGERLIAAKVARAVDAPRKAAPPRETGDAAEPRTATRPAGRNAARRTK
jgi:hypothetical protein